MIEPTVKELLDSHAALNIPPSPSRLGCEARLFRPGLSAPIHRFALHQGRGGVSIEVSEVSDTSSSTASCPYGLFRRGYVFLGAVGILAGFVGCAQAPAPTPPPPTTTTTTVAPEPTPSPSPSPTPTPEIEACFPVGVEWVPSPPEKQDPEEMMWAVNEAQEYIGDRCGFPMVESLKLLADELESRGFCSRFFEPDMVCVMRKISDDERCEEHHAVFSANGCWLSETFRGIYERKP